MLAFPAMSPRRYRMTKRREAVGSTRSRIVEAAIKLHSTRGTSATSWDDIAAMAGVSRASVYHHFPSLDSLIPACAEVAFEMADVPTLETAASGFADLPSAKQRISRLVRETSKCYTAGEEWLRAAWRERDVVPAMQRAVSRLQRAGEVLIEAAVSGTSVDRDDRRTLAVLLDFPFWDALARAGMSRRSIPDHIEGLALQIVNRRGGTKS